MLLYGVEHFILVVITLVLPNVFHFKDALNRVPQFAVACGAMSI